MRGIAGLILAMLFVAPAGAYSTTLTAEQMQAAIAYGNELRANGKVVEGKGIFLQGTEWARDLPEGEGYVLWMTPFLYVAEEQAVKGQVSAETRGRILPGFARFTAVTVVVRSPEQRDARTLRVLVQAGNSVIRPGGTRIREPVFVEETQRWTYSVVASFAYSERFQPKGTVQVVVGWPDKSRMVEFDLGAMR